jgi:16S rRNA (cytosine1402-N4)-methyltransferase
MVHEPVMTAEAIGFLRPERGGLFLDCTVGTGGHARALLEQGATRLLGLDRDRDALAVAADQLARWRDRLELVHADYRDVEAVLDARGLREVDGALADLGMSSFQLGQPGRGFSFQRDEVLDMRMDRSQGPTAAELLRDASEATLADVLARYGEEPRARQVARAIVEGRRREPVLRTGQLAALVHGVLPRRGRIDSATRTFQALRVWVNRELEDLDEFVAAVMRRLRVGARFVVITFHSLEDRIIKFALRGRARSDARAVRILTKHVIRPARDELARNPRARSAKLRAAERVA